MCILFITNTIFASGDFVPQTLYRMFLPMTAWPRTGASPLDPTPVCGVREIN